MSLSLLLDANLSWRLVNQIQDMYPNSCHVEKCDLPIPAKDREIWDYAKKNKMIIVTNDEDFYQFTVYHGFPPNIVLLKMGNQSISMSAKILREHYEDIKKLSESEEYGVLEIY